MQESFADTLKGMKNERNLTLQQISDASGVPVSTVNRILNGQTENPSFRDIAAIVAALDGSLDALTGLQKIDPASCQLLDANVMQLLLTMQNHYTKNLENIRQQHIHEMEISDKHYRESLADKNRWLRRLFLCLVMLIGVISFLLIIDFTNPALGFFHT